MNLSLFILPFLLPTLPPAPKSVSVDAGVQPGEMEAHRSAPFLKRFPNPDAGEPEQAAIPSAKPRRSPSRPAPPPPDNSIQWKPLLWQSAFFLSLQHTVRLATEPGTREGMKGPFFRGYFDSVTNMHGWETAIRRW